MQVMIGISVGFYDLYVTCDENMICKAFLKNWHRRGIFSILVSKPDQAKNFRIVWNIVLKCTKELVNNYFCSPESKITSNIRIGPELWSLDKNCTLYQF